MAADAAAAVQQATAVAAASDATAKPATGNDEDVSRSANAAADARRIPDPVSQSAHFPTGVQVPERVAEALVEAGQNRVGGGNHLSISSRLSRLPSAPLPALSSAAPPAIRHPPAPPPRAAATAVVRGMAADLQEVAGRCGEEWRGAEGEAETEETEETEEERGHRLRWIAYYVTEGRLDHAYSLGWDGEMAEEGLLVVQEEAHELGWDGEAEAVVEGQEASGGDGTAPNKPANSTATAPTTEAPIVTEEASGDALAEADASVAPVPIFPDASTPPLNPAAPVAALLKHASSFGKPEVAFAAAAAPKSLSLSATDGDGNHACSTAREAEDSVVLGPDGVTAAELAEASELRWGVQAVVVGPMPGAMPVESRSPPNPFAALMRRVSSFPKVVVDNVAEVAEKVAEEAKDSWEKAEAAQHEVRTASIVGGIKPRHAALETQQSGLTSPTSKLQTSPKPSPKPATSPAAAIDVSFSVQDHTTTSFPQADFTRRLAAVTGVAQAAIQVIVTDAEARHGVDVAVIVYASSRAGAEGVVTALSQPAATLEDALQVTLADEADEAKGSAAESIDPGDKTLSIPLATEAPLAVVGEGELLATESEWEHWDASGGIRLVTKMGI